MGSVLVRFLHQMWRPAGRLPRLDVGSVKFINLEKWTEKIGVSFDYDTIKAATYLLQTETFCLRDEQVDIYIACER